MIDHGKFADTVKERGGTVPPNLIRLPCTDNPTGHPAPTPLKLADMVVRYLCPPGGKVLDPWAGSGTIGVACRDAKARDGSPAPREYVAIEKHWEWVEKARKRLAGEAGHTGCGREPS
jgi:DNA modification methylase